MPQKNDMIKTLIQKQKNSLTFRIFMITSSILLGSSAVTYLIIALAVPVTSTTIIRTAVVGTYAEEEPTAQNTADDSHAYSIKGDVSVTVTEGKDIYNIALAAESYGDFVFEALLYVIPCLFAIMLVFSTLCARFYSRYITRPIVRLSRISEQMARLDFTQTCTEEREDEIGTLARNLNRLSVCLSAALTDLQAANHALKQDIDRERALEQQRTAFFSAASHELKTPVTILKGQLNGMIDGIGVYQNRDKYLAKALQTVSRMEGLIQEILTVSRLENRNLPLSLQQIELGGLIKERLYAIEDLLEYKRIGQKLSLSAPAVVSADPALLEKAIDNLLSNAVFYSPYGALLSVSITKTEGCTELLIHNSGSHIPAEALPYVFEAFYRADGSRNRNTGGSGLGLYIVQMILKLHGAQYKIENTEDGVQFIVRFFGSNKPA